MSNILTTDCAPGIVEAIAIIQGTDRGRSVEEAIFQRMVQILKEPDADGPSPAGFVQMPAVADQVMLRRVFRMVRGDMPWVTKELLAHVYALFIGEKPFDKEIAHRAATKQNADLLKGYDSQDDHQIVELINAGMDAAKQETSIKVPDVTLIPGLEYALRITAHGVFGGARDEMLSDLNKAIAELSASPQALGDQHFVVMPITACYECLDDAVVMKLRQEGLEVEADDLIDLYGLFISCRPHAPLEEDECGDMFRLAWYALYERSDWTHRPTAMSYFAHGWYQGLRVYSSTQ